MKFRWLILIAVVAACCGGFQTTAIAAPSAGFSVHGTDPARLTVEYVLGELSLSTSTAAGQAVTVVALEGALPRQKTGFPELPTVTLSLPITAHGTPTIKIVSRREREIASARVLPSLGHVTRDIDPGTLTRFFGPVYTSHEIYPAVTVELGRPFVLGDRRGVNLRLNPVRWDAARGVLLVTEAITVEVVTAGTGGANILPDDAPASSREFGELHDQVFPRLVDTTTRDKYSSPLARGRMLIISHDDFAPALAPFRAWKARRGIATELVLMSETDGTAADLRRLVADRYLAASGLTWLVLVGDRDQVPTNVGTYDGSDADSPYAMILGDDLYPELFVSRVSAGDIRQVETQIAKFIAYERDPDIGYEAAWYGRAAGVASDEGVPADYERADLLRTDLLSRDYDRVDRIYQGLGATTAAITAAVNEGRSLINYLGHGTGVSWESVAYRIADIEALNNGGRLPWIIDVSCYNGDIARETCFAEAWLRAGTPEVAAGAVGMIAASSLAPWTPPTVMQAEVVDLLSAGTRQTLGALYYSGLMKVLDEYAGVPVATQVMEQNIVFGDGSLMVRTRAPQEYEVSLPAAVESVSEMLSLTVTGPAGGTVAVTHEGQLLGVADFEVAGVINVPLTGDLSALAVVAVTVTGANMVPYEGTLSVAAGTTAVLDQMLREQPVLHGNYPNPFNPSTRIVFELPAAQSVQLTVYDIRGHVVRRLAGGRLASGRHEIVWQGRDDRGREAPSGTYLYRLVTASGAQGGRMTLSK